MNTTIWSIIIVVAVIILLFVSVYGGALIASFNVIRNMKRIECEMCGAKFWGFRTMKRCKYCDARSPREWLVQESTGGEWRTLESWNDKTFAEEVRREYEQLEEKFGPHDPKPIYRVVHKEQI